VVILLVVWDLTIRIFRIPPYLIPAPDAVVKQLFVEWPRLWRESLVTTYATLGGFALSIAFGIPMALLIAYSRTVESFVYPSIFAGLKVSVTLAVVGAVVGEFVGSNSGIGYLLQIANGNFDLPLMFAALTVLSAIGVLLFVAVDMVERLMIPWHASQRNDFNATA